MTGYNCSRSQNSNVDLLYGSIHIPEFEESTLNDERPLEKQTFYFEPTIVTGTFYTSDGRKYEYTEKHEVNLRRLS